MDYGRDSIGPLLRSRVSDSENVATWNSTETRDLICIIARIRRNRPFVLPTTSEAIMMRRSGCGLRDSESDLISAHGMKSRSPLIKRFYFYKYTNTCEITKCEGEGSKRGKQTTSRSEVRVIDDSACKTSLTRYLIAMRRVPWSGAAGAVDPDTDQRQ